MGFGPALVLLDNAIDGSQAESSSFAGALGGEKRLKNPCQSPFIHPGTGVRDAQTNKSTQARFRIMPEAGIIHFDRLGADGQLTASRHRFLRVGGQVKDDLFHHHWIGFDGRQARRIIELQGDALSNGAAHRPARIVDHLLQIQRVGLNNLPAAERQKLAGQVGGALRGQTDFFQRPGCFRLKFLVFHEQGRVALHHAQQIVKIMRHAGGQLPDRFHFLRLP